VIEARFQAFYDGTRHALYGYLYRALGDSASAQDLFQETYLKILGADTGGLDDAALRAYLFRIATNLLRDRFRKDRRAKAWEEEILRTHEEPSAQSSDIDSAVAALERMSPQNRSLLWLAYVEGYDHKQIAEMLGLGMKSVRVLLFRARKKLLALLQGEATNLETKS
jgi:RNA polymerase sigma-70 factor (ECF subfamily)